MLRTFLFSILFLGLCQIGTSQIIITEIADPNDVTSCRFVELFNLGSGSVDLSTGYSLQRYTNGNAAPQTAVALTGVIGAGSYYIVANNGSGYMGCYGSMPDQSIGTGGPADSNGDDQIQLLDPTNAVLDIFGVPGEDGSFTCHEFEDGRAERAASVTMGNAGTWNEANWNVWSDTDVMGCTNHIHLPQNAADMDPGYWIGDTSIVVAQDTFVLINELSACDQWVELYNTTDSAINVASWWLCNDPAYDQISSLTSDTIIPANGFIVINWSSIGTTDGELGLYKTNAFDDSTAIHDYVAYNALQNGANGRADVAVAAGVWGPADTSYVDAPTGASCNTIAVINPSATRPTQTSSIDWCEVISTSGAANDVCFDSNCPDEGALVITEILYNGAFDDTAGEWFEIYNTTAAAIDMNGMTIEDGSSGPVSINNGGPLMIMPSAYLVLANDKDTTVNCSTPDYLYSGFILGNSGDVISLKCSNGSLIDQVNYDFPTSGGDITEGNGQAIQLNPDSISHTANDIQSNWCLANSLCAADSSSQGTPGSANDICTYECTIDYAGLDNSPGPLCIDGDYVFEIYFSTSNGSDTVEVVDITNGVVLATGANSPLVITLVDNTSNVPFDVIVRNISDSMCTSNPFAVPVVSCESIDCPDQGDLIFTEIMSNPSATDDIFGEYFEMYNVSANPIDLVGMTIIDAGFDGLIIDTSVIVGPGEFVVFARNANSATNGGLTVDYEYSGMSLTAIDEIILVCSDTIIDSVYYDSNFPVVAGASMVLDAFTFTAMGNDSSANWCESTTEIMAGGDLGTPGTTNDQCSAPCPPNWVLTGTESGIADYETDGDIISTQVIESTATVDYDATTEISLEADFEVQLGAIFEAFIDGCNNGAGGSNYNNNIQLK